MLQAQKKERVLMVGNSFTFYYNLPTTIQLFAQNRGLDWKIHQSTAGGASLKQHWYGEKKLLTKRKLKRKKYTTFIIQEHSTLPLKSIDSTSKYLNLLLSKTHSKVKHYLYATWSYPNIIGSKKRPSFDSYSIENALKNIPVITPVELLPVGRAFDLFHQRFPLTTLFTTDLKHPNPVGSYLAACVIFGKISGQSTQGLPRRMAEKEKRGKKIYYFIVEKEAALRCQQIADEVLFGTD